jgi:hypothetical protein
VRRPGGDRWPRRARPHVNGAGLGVVEGWPGGDAPALADSRCSGAAGAAAAVGAAVATATTAVVTTTTTAAATALTIATPAAAAAALTTAASARGGGGVGGQGPPKGAGKDGGRHCWTGVGEGRCCCPPEAGRAVAKPDEASASRVSSLRRRLLRTSWKEGNGRTHFR